MGSTMEVVSRMIKKFRWPIVVLWVTVNVLGLLYGLKFFDETITDFGAPDDSDATRATDALTVYFPATMDANLVSVYIQSFDGNVFDGEMMDKLTTFDTELHKALLPKKGFRSYASYYTWNNRNLPMMAEAFIPLTGLPQTTTFITVAVDTTDSDVVEDFVVFLKDTVVDLQKSLQLDDTTSMEETGLPLFVLDSIEGIKKDSEVLDMYILPASLFILAMVIQNLPIMIVPIFALVSSLMCQFLIMYEVAQVMDVISFVPSLMLSLTFATSIDYALFMLARACEDLRGGIPLDDAVVIMLTNAGHTILMSGATLMICFMGLLFFSLEMLKSIGVAAACTLFSVLLANLTLTPALLFIAGENIMKVHAVINLEKFAEWLEYNFVTPFWGASRKYSQVSAGESSDPHMPFLTDTDGKKKKSSMFDGWSYKAGQLDPEDEGSQAVPAIGNPMLADEANENSNHDSEISISEEELFRERETELHDYRNVRNTFWYRTGSWLLVTWQGVAVCVVVVLLMIPVDLYALTVKPDISFTALLPKDSGSYRAYFGIADNFGPGYPTPYRILLEDVQVDRSLYNQNGFDRVKGAVDYLIESLPYTNRTDFYGANLINGQYVPYNDMKIAVDAGVNVTQLNSTEQTYALMYYSFFTRPENVTTSSATVEDVQRAVYFWFYLEINPYSLEGVDWLKDARKLTDHIKDEFELNIYYADGCSQTYDAVTEVYSEFPAMIAATLCTVFLLMAIAFKSISAPCRLIATIVITLAFTYGFAVLVYQHGLLSFLNVDAFGNYNSINWLPPIMCFTVIVGLGLDYDVFLISRILELRENGFSSNGSILKGICKTGNIITNAGIIMAVAFSGLLLSGELALNQVAFLLVVSVLLDTFVVRTVLVPILMGMAGEHAWWPRKIDSQGNDNYGFVDESTPAVLAWWQDFILGWCGSGKSDAQ